MKVVHLNTHSYGGAATVARRLHLAELAGGIESRLLTMYGLPSDRTPNYRALKNARLLYALRSASADPRLYGIGKAVQRFRAHPNLANRPEGLDIFSPLNERPQFSSCLVEDAPDIIHLHWVNGFVDHGAFFTHNRDRKFVWTLHDMNPITGGCHHADGCEGFMVDCRSCPQLRGTVDPDYSSRVLQSKEEGLRALRDDQVVIVSPSRWLLEHSARSRVTRRFRHEYIENPSMTITPASQSCRDEKRRLGISTDKKIVVFAAANLRNPRKGFDLLFEAVGKLDDRHAVQLVGIGQRSDAPAGLDVNFVGAVSDEAQLASYYRCADAVVVPSVAENAPLTVIEALTCGAPVIAFSVGGIPEMVNEANGAAINVRSADSLRDALDDVLFRREFDRAAISAGAARFAPNAVMSKYKRVYEELLAT